MRSHWLWIPVLLGVACDGDPGKPSSADVRPDKESRIEGEQRAMRIESRDIDAYVRRKGLSVSTTGTGLRHQLVKDSTGANAEPDDLVWVNYRVELIDGRECYASSAGQAESFRVEHDDVESGLHEGIQLMSPGDSAILIIPSHRAFGLIGDRDRIPMRSTVIYFIGLERINGRQ